MLSGRHYSQARLVVIGIEVQIDAREVYSFDTPVSTREDDCYGVDCSE